MNRIERGPRLFTGKEIIERIFDYMYYIRVPYMATKSVEEIRLTGVPKSGIKAVDMAKATEKINIYATLNTMIELYKVGVPIYVINKKDSIEIFNAINEHIANWHESLRTSINSYAVPYEDLVVMDEFARETVKFIRDNNLHISKLTKENDSFLSDFKQLKRFTVDNIVRNRNASEILDNGQDNSDSHFVINEYRSSFFRERYAQQNR
jgi:hypothetical protein